MLILHGIQKLNVVVSRMQFDHDFIFDKKKNKEQAKKAKKIFRMTTINALFNLQEDNSNYKQAFHFLSESKRGNSHVNSGMFVSRN